MTSDTTLAPNTEFTESRLAEFVDSRRYAVDRYPENLADLRERVVASTTQDIQYDSLAIGHHFFSFLGAGFGNPGAGNGSGSDATVNFSLKLIP
jgi:hypothetical protein